jgi:LmbE family N-acetylglucosaminyl deacetylase
VTTIVFLHAHPDDESTQTSVPWPAPAPRATGSSSSMRRTATTATRRRTSPTVRRWSIDGGLEAEASAQATGTQQIVWLGYADSA